MKKLISLILIFVIALGVFAACNKAEVATEQTDTSPSTSNTPTEVPTVEEVIGRPQRDPTVPPMTIPPSEPTEPPAPEPVLTLDPDNMPEDFSFSLRFNVYGCCYYDSAKGELCGGAHEDDPEEYTAPFRMDEEEFSKVYRMIAEMEIGSYPDEYDPINDPSEEISMDVEPPELTVLTVRANGLEKEITAYTAYSDEGYDEKSQTFLDVCRYIENTVTESEEWKALPDNKILFE